MPPTYAGALSVLNILRTSGHQALLAGGCVRDRLRAVEPLDYDIATSASPQEVQAAFPSTEPVGAAFGVVLVIAGGAAYEVATFRADGPYLDQRRPSAVRFASAEEDARRRDFTVNGMFYDPDKDAVLDFVGGRRDLDAGLLRAIGDPAERFNEDRLRILRCVRFACQLGFSIEPATWEAVKRQPRPLEGLAFERINAELTKILRSPRPRLGLELLDEAGLLEALLPELAPLKGCPQPPQFHPEGDVWEHTLRVVQAAADLSGGAPSAALAWGALLHDVGKPPTKTFTDRLRFHGHEVEGARMARALFERLKVGKELSDAACTLVADHLRLDPIKQMKVATLKRLLRRADIEDLLTLHKADCLGSHGDMEFYELARAKQAEFARDEVVGLRPPALLDGTDLIAWGYAPGPLFKAVLDAVEDEQLEGRLADKAAAKDFVETRFPRP
ncbi:MAG TPA: CCA tRNA nucleotidyltransferase [bacterium]|jgi:putative nucleotidyltransferase with HDIG domain|nr:CCA tRNA nucleotidyltransferase [bacterium]